MTLAVFFGCTFIAFGPAFSLFLFTIARDPLRIIILIAGSVRGWGMSGHGTVLWHWYRYGSIVAPGREWYRGGGRRALVWGWYQYGDMGASL